MPQHARTDQVVAVDHDRDVDLVAQFGRRGPAQQVGRGADAVDLDVLGVFPEALAGLQVGRKTDGGQEAFDRGLGARHQAAQRSTRRPVVAVSVGADQPGGRQCRLLRGRQVFPVGAGDAGRDRQPAVDVHRVQADFRVDLLDRETEGQAELAGVARLTALDGRDIGAGGPLLEGLRTELRDDRRRRARQRCCPIGRRQR